MTLNKAFGLRISKLLVEKKMTKYRLEKLSCISHSSMSRIFNEVNDDVHFSTIAKIASAFEMSLTEFFDDPVFNEDNLNF